MSCNTAVTDDGARLDIFMYGFWGGRFEKAFVDVRVFNPCAQSNRRSPISAVYRRHEQEKKRHYEQGVQNTLLSLHLLCQPLEVWAKLLPHSTKGSPLWSVKNGTLDTVNWIRCRLSFALLRASIMSIRGARSSRHHAAAELPLDLQITEGQIG